MIEQGSMAALSRTGIARLSAEDPTLFSLLESEIQRQASVLPMVAASSIADPSVLACAGSSTLNVTTEGYPGKRFHAGCDVVDQIERLAVERAREAFHAQYANVQPHSGSSANAIVMFGLLKPSDTIMGLDLDAGGHLTHGSRASFSGQVFNAVSYGLDAAELIDYDTAHSLAKQHRPKLIICGGSSYTRAIDFARFREIADEVGALLMADISHISGLVAAGLHESPINHAHITTTSTYKQLYGPRGGLILMGRDYESPAPGGRKSLSDTIQNSVFPFFQGTPDLSSVAAKARALAMVATPEFKRLARSIVENAKALASSFENLGYRVVSGGTDNHMVLIDVLSSKGITGVIAERALEACGIIINKNKIPGDMKSPLITSGMRLGTNSLALMGMGPEEMHLCAALVDRILSSVEASSDDEYQLAPEIVETAHREVRALRQRFPTPHYLGNTQSRGIETTLHTQPVP
jgi:glycine hydroxymethyltransferase